MSEIISTPYTIPATVTVTFLVICRLPEEIEPSPDALKQIARKWIRVYIAPPLLEPVTRAFESPAFTMHVARTADIPDEMLAAITADLSADEGKKLRTAPHMIVCNSDDPVLSDRSGLWACLAAAMACASHYNSRWIVNTATEAPIDPALQFGDFHSGGVPRMRPFVRCRISAGDAGEAVMATSGLSLFGLPEIAIANVPPVTANHLHWFLSALGQILSAAVMDLGRSQPEAATIVFPLETVVTVEYMRFAYNQSPPEGTGGHARVRLDRMPESSYLALLPPAGVEQEISYWLQTVLAAFFPSDSEAQPSTTIIDATPVPNPLAVESLPGIKMRFLSGEFKRWQLLVKSGFPSPTGDPEWMWMAVEEWYGDLLIGSLVSRPELATNLSEGQTVQVRENEIHDWAVMGPKGKMEGGFSDAGGAAGQPPAPRAVVDPFASLHPPDRALLEWIHDPWFQNALATNAKAWYHSRVPALSFDNAKARWQFGLTGVATIGIGLLILHLAPQARTAAPAVPWIVGAVGTLLIIAAGLPRPKATLLQRTFAAVAADGEPAVGYVVFSPKSGKRKDTFNEVVVILFTLDPEERGYETLPALVERLRKLRGAAGVEPEFRETAALVNAPFAVLQERKRLPDEMAQGRDIYLATIKVSQSHLLPRTGSVPFFPIMATRGESGFVEMIPYDVLGRTYAEAG